MNFAKQFLSVFGAPLLAALTLSIILATSSPVSARNAVVLERVNGFVDSTKVRANVPITLDMYFENDVYVSVTNGLRIFSPTGATWTPPMTDILHKDSLMTYYWDGIVQSYYYGVTGNGSDTLGFGGLQIFQPGLEPGYSQPIMRVAFSVEADQIGHTICVDSSFFPPGGSWLWSTSQGTFVPEWDGPYCFEIVSCCQGPRGDINLSGGINVSDLSELVGVLFKGYPTPPCVEATDVDGNGSWNVVDVTTLVSYLFKAGPEPPACP